MTAPALAYRNPHPKTSYTLTELQEIRNTRFGFYHHHEYFGPCDVCERQKQLDKEYSVAYARPGWHGPLDAAGMAAHREYEVQYALQVAEAQKAAATLKARRDANPMWKRVCSVIAQHSGYDEGDDETADAVMDVVYGKGRW